MNVKEIVLEMVSKKSNIDIEHLLSTDNLTTDLGLDSLSIVELTMEVEKKFDVEIDIDIAINTVYDYVRAVENERISLTIKKEDLENLLQSWIEEAYIPPVTNGEFAVLWEKLKNYKE